MSNFIRVLGDNLDYKGKKYYMYVNANCICQIHPAYAVKDASGGFWLSTPDHEGVEIISYFLFDNNGNKYSCGNHKELKKLGLSELKTKGKDNIGYIDQKDSEKVEVDIS